jgi:hypothetical protein
MAITGYQNQETGKRSEKRRLHNKVTITTPAPARHLFVNVRNSIERHLVLPRRDQNFERF